MTQPEPCIGLDARCRSPVACAGFGYCRERNRAGVPDEATATHWRQRAANPHANHPESISTRLEDVIRDWKTILPPNAIVQVRADLIVSAYQEIERLTAKAEAR